MPISKNLNPKNDVACKKLFSTSANADLTLELLNHALDWHLASPIVSLQFPTPQQLARSHGSKDSYRDVLCVDAQGQHYIVAMQVAKDEAFRLRAQYDAAKAFSGQLRKGEPYSKRSRVILLAFADFSFFAKSTRYKANYLTLDGQTYDDELPGMRFTFIALTRFKKPIQGKPITALRKEEELYLFLEEAAQLNPEALAHLVANDPIMARLQQELTQCYWSPEELAPYDSAEKRRQDELSRLTQAKERGVQEGLQQGIDLLVKKGLVSKQAALEALKP